VIKITEQKEGSKGIFVLKQQTQPKNLVYILAAYVDIIDGGAFSYKI